MKRAVVLTAALCVALHARAAIYWESGVRGPKPTVCFAGDGAAVRKDRVEQIREVLKQFEYAANIRFQHNDTCTNEPQANGDDFWKEEIRVVIPNTGGNLFNLVAPVPGKNCPINEAMGGWSRRPNQLESERTCVFNLHLGDDNFKMAPAADPSGGSTPFVNHTLHEFGHALGLRHEHLRKDVFKEWVLTFFQKINGVDVAEAQAIYDAGYRNVPSIADAAVATLQQIPGFSNVNDAQALKDNAKVTQVPPYGGPDTFYISAAYDPLSVMHYSWVETLHFAPGNYANTGLSALDRLALHILYPEDNRVAEFVGRRVLRTGETLSLVSQWQMAGADVTKMVKNFSWKIDGLPASSTSKASVKMPSAGAFKLDFTYTDFLDRGYAYTGEVRVLTPQDFAKKISSRAVAGLPLM